jgi:5'(3')-deoxyribonucleotidase
MRNNLTIFLDLDGVIVDFQKSALEILGMELDWSAPESKNQWEMTNVLGVSNEDFWEPLNNEDFWAGLDFAPDGKDIIHLCESFTDNIYLLTSPNLHPSSYSGKAMWIEKNLPKYLRRTLIAPCKEACAQVTACLIDDKNENIDKFVDHGGFGILVPRPWNNMHHLEDCALLQCEHMLKYFFEGEQAWLSAQTGRRSCTHSNKAGGPSEG